MAEKLNWYDCAKRRAARKDVAAADIAAAKEYVALKRAGNVFVAAAMMRDDTDGAIARGLAALYAFESDEAPKEDA